MPRNDKWSRSSLKENLIRKQDRNFNLTKDECLRKTFQLISDMTFSSRSVPVCNQVPLGVNDGVASKVFSRLPSALAFYSLNNISRMNLTLSFHEDLLS